MSALHGHAPKPRVWKIQSRGSPWDFLGCLWKPLLRAGHCNVEELLLSPAHLPARCAPKAKLPRSAASARPPCPRRAVAQSPGSAVPPLSSTPSTAFSGSLPRHIVQRLSQSKCPTVVVKVYTFLFYSLNFLEPRGVFISIYSCSNFLISEHFCQAANSY